MDTTQALESFGLTLPTPAYIAGALLFGLLGLAAYRYGKRTERSRSKWLGVAPMLYPYVVPQTWLMYVIGVVLCAGVYFDRG